jgi:phage terminase small subunit
MALTPKQERFIAEYLIDLNATQAAIRAGYSPKTAYSIGNENLSKPDIALRVKQRRDEVAKVAELTQEWVLSNLKDVVSKSMQAVEVEKFDYESKEMVGTGEYVYDSRGANTALQLIGKHLGMFTDKLEVNGNMVIFKGEKDLED